MDASLAQRGGSHPVRPHAPGLHRHGEMCIRDRRQLARAERSGSFAGLSFCASVKARYPNHSNEVLAHGLVRDLVRVGALKDEDGLLVPL